MFKSCHYFGEVSNVYSCHESKCGSFLFFDTNIFKCLWNNFAKAEVFALPKILPKWSDPLCPVFFSVVRCIDGYSNPNQSKTTGKGDHQAENSIRSQTASIEHFSEEPLFLRVTANKMKIVDHISYSSLPSLH